MIGCDVSMENLMKRVNELKKVISTLESMIAKLKIKYSSKEIDKRKFEHDLKALNLGLESLKKELKNTLMKIAYLADKRLSFREAFHFYSAIDKPLNISAFSLRDFLEKLKIVPIESIEFHSTRGDFSSWIKDVIGDPKLAKKIMAIKEKGEELRKKLIHLIYERINTYRKVLKFIE